MLSRKKRDAKFLIFQSLYLIAISILFYKGTDLSMNKVTTIEKGDTVISITEMPPTPGVSDTLISKIVWDSVKYFNEYVDTSKDSVITKQILEDKDAKIAERKNWVPPNSKSVKTTDSKKNDQTVDDPYGNKVKK